jgi:hypothetical protein
VLEVRVVLGIAPREPGYLFLRATHILPEEEVAAVRKAGEEGRVFRVKMKPEPP